LVKEKVVVNEFKRVWERLETYKERPTRHTGAITEMAYQDFKKYVEKNEQSFADYVCRSLYSGEVWIIRKSFTPEFMKELREKTVAWSKSRPSSFHKILEGTPDFHRIVDLETGKNYAFAACKHSTFFYRHNDDPLGIWPTITERWRVFKQLMGLSPTEYEENTPKDGVVDRIQVVRYPPKIGYLEPHSDPYRHQRLFFSAYMSKRGVDYEGGGFYTVQKKDKPLEMESYVNVGDICVGYATVCHGVAPCDRDKEPSWDKDDGRWFLSMYSTASDEVPDRHTGHPVKVKIDGVTP
jgi:hypothetical protein